MILLAHRDLLKLDHIFDRERAAVAPVPGQDPAYTGLGFERKTYIIIRGIVKFLLSGSKRQAIPVDSHGHPTTTSSASSSNLSLVARLLLDPAFQNSFLTHEFLSRTFQRKLQHFIKIFPSDLVAASTMPSDSHASAPLSIDLQLCAAMRTYGQFFQQLLNDSHIQLCASTMRQYELLLEHFFSVLYVDIILPLIRPEQYMRDILNARLTVLPRTDAASASDAKQKATSTAGAISSVAPLSIIVADLPPARASPPFVVSSTLLIFIGFMYHFLHQPVPIDILQRSKAHIDAVTGRSCTTITPAQSLQTLRDLLMRSDVYEAWSRIAANAPTASAPPAHDAFSYSSVPHFASTLHALVVHPTSLAVIDHLQLHAAHVAFCINKVIDELNQLWREEQTPLPQRQIVGSSNNRQTLMVPMLVTISRVESTSAVGAAVPLADAASKFADTGVASTSPSPTSPSFLASISGFFFGATQAATSPSVKPTTGAVSPLPALPPNQMPVAGGVVPSVLALLPLPPLAPALISPRSNFDVYVQHQLRLWCSRVLEGRGFAHYQQLQSKNGMRTPTNLASSTFVFDRAGRGESTVPLVFHPLAPISPVATVTDSSTSDIFYVELMFFDPVFIEHLLSFAFIWRWAEEHDEVTRRVRRHQRQQQTIMPSTTTGVNERLTVSRTMPPSFVYHSLLLPVVMRNLSNPKSTPSDLGPLRNRESIALVCREVSTLLQEEHIANFLNRSENFWRFLIDTRWWDIIRDATPTTAARASIGASPARSLLVRPRVPVSRATESSLHSLLTLVSNKESSYYLVLLELGHSHLFHDIFSDANVARVLALARLVCSMRVHGIMASQTASASAAVLHSDDLYSSLTAPFTVWGIVHSLSVVPELRQQYRGAIHWFLSKRNMEMQVAIWRAVREVLYGEDEDEEFVESTRGASEVPPPARLHTLDSSAGVASPYSRQKVRLRRLLSVAQICKSVHGSGVIQAVFTFPLATAHFYSIVTAEYFWPSRTRTLPPRAIESNDLKTPIKSTAPDSVSGAASTTSVLMQQLFTLLYTMARTAESHSFMHIPTVRSALLEWIGVGLDEFAAYGTGETRAAQERARHEHEIAVAAQQAQAARTRHDAAERKRLEAEEAAIVQAAQQISVTNARRRTDARKKIKSAVIPSKSVPMTPGILSPAPSPSPSPTAVHDMFAASASYRPESNSTHATINNDRERMATGELSTNAPLVSGAMSVAEGLVPDNLPMRYARDAELDDAMSGSDAVPSTSAPTADDDRVVLPPPFSFESATPAPIAPIEDDERARLVLTQPYAERTVNAAPMPTAPTNAEQMSAAPIVSTVAPGGSFDLSSLSSASSSSPSLPQRHRLLYRFFQLLLRQSIFKLVLTSTSLWEMLSDVSFLDILTSLCFGTIETDASATAAAPTSIASNSRPSPLRTVRDRLSATQHRLQAKHAQLRLVQKLLAHYRFKIFMAELKSKQFEVQMADCMTQLLAFINGESGRALMHAVMEGLTQQSQAGGVASSSSSASSSLSHRVSSLLRLLAHPSTGQLLTSSRFWLLFADARTLDYFSNGQYIRLALHQQHTIAHAVKRIARAAMANVPTIRTDTSSSGSESMADAPSIARSVPSSARPSRRAVIKEFVQKKLHPRTGSTTVGDTDGAPAIDPPPVGLASLHHFIAIVQAVYGLFTGQPVEHDELRANL